MQYSIVNYNVIEKNSDFRYEPEFFLPKYIQTDSLLLKLHVIRLGALSTLTNGEAFDSNKFSIENGVSVAKIGDVTQKRIFSEWENIPKSYFGGMSAQYLRHNDILMTLTGDPPDVGKVQLIFKPPMEEASWNQRVGLLRLKKQKYIKEPEYLFAALTSRYCREQIERWAKGIRQRNVGNPAVKRVLVPIFSVKLQEVIAQIVHKSYELIDESISFYLKAEKLVLSELGLFEWTPTTELSNIQNFSETVAAKRMDPEYFQTQYAQLEKVIKNYQGGYKPLHQAVNIKDKNYYPKDEVLYKYIELSGINTLGEVASCDLILGKDLPTRARRIVNQGDLLLSSIEGSLNTIGLITMQENNLLCSNGFFVINSEQLPSELLFILFKTPPFQLLLKKGCTGSILASLNKGELGKIPIPLIMDPLLNDIKNLVQNMYKAKQESKKLLETATKAIETAMEHGEDSAMMRIEKDLT